MASNDLLLVGLATAGVVLLGRARTPQASGSLEEPLASGLPPEYEQARADRQRLIDERNATGAPLVSADLDVYVSELPPAAAVVVAAGTPSVLVDTWSAPQVSESSYSPPIVGASGPSETGLVPAPFSAPLSEPYVPPLVLPYLPPIVEPYVPPAPEPPAVLYVPPVAPYIAPPPYVAPPPPPVLPPVVLPPAPPPVYVPPPAVAYVPPPTPRPVVPPVAPPGAFIALPPPAARPPVAPALPPATRPPLAMFFQDVFDLEEAEGISAGGSADTGDSGFTSMGGDSGADSGGDSGGGPGE